MRETSSLSCAEPEIRQVDAKHRQATVKAEWSDRRMTGRSTEMVWSASQIELSDSLGLKTALVTGAIYARNFLYSFKGSP